MSADLSVTISIHEVEERVKRIVDNMPDVEGQASVLAEGIAHLKVAIELFRQGALRDDVMRWLVGVEMGPSRPDVADAFARSARAWGEQ